MTLFEAAEDPQAVTGPDICRMVVAYDGTDFRGFAAQRDQRTVAGVLGAALTRVLRTEVDLACAGRTDAGVHGWGQVISFDVPAEALERRGLDGLVRSCNGLMGPAIVVRDAEVVGDEFDARFSALWRRYRYTVLNSETPRLPSSICSWRDSAGWLR